MTEVLRNQSDAQSTLSEREMAILDFEGRWWHASAPKDQAIRAEFDLSASRYYQILNQLMDRPEALEYSKLLVKRLRRQREERQRQRSAARLNAR